MFHKKTCKGILAAVGSVGWKGENVKMGRNEALSMASKKHIMIFSVHQFSVVILFFFKLSLQSASLLWRTSRFGAFFYLWMLFGSFLNLKDLIFYSNSQINTSNSDFLPKHIWTYPKIKIYFDSHPPFFSSLSFPNHIELFRDPIGSTLRCIQNLNIPFYWRQLSVRSASATLLLLGCLCFWEYFVHALTSALWMH